MEYGEGARPTAPAPPPTGTGHAIIHTLYQQSLRHNAEFFLSSISPST